MYVERLNHIFDQTYFRIPTFLGAAAGLLCEVNESLSFLSSCESVSFSSSIFCALTSGEAEPVKIKSTDLIKVRRENVHIS